METIHIRLLKELKLQGLSAIVNVCPFLIAEYKKPKKDLLMVPYNREINRQMAFINDLVERKLIKFYRKEEKTFLEIICKTARNENPKWFDDYQLDIQITTNGLEFLENYDLVQSNFKVNDASINNYKSQKWFSISTISIAALAAIISFLSYIKSDNVALDKAVLQTQIDSIKKVLIQNK